MSTLNICPPTNIDTMVVGSFYGMRQRGSRRLFHAGLDFCGRDAAPTGKPVYAIADGIVRYTWNEVWPGSRMNATSGYGNCVLVEHPSLGNGPAGSSAPRSSGRSASSRACEVADWSGPLPAWSP